MAVHVIDEANRCLQCKKPMCQQGCPIHTPIPAMIKALKEGGTGGGRCHAVFQQPHVTGVFPCMQS